MNTVQLKRPTSITVICMLVWCMAPIIILGLLMPSIRQSLTTEYGTWYPLMTFVTTIGSTIGMVGYWTMKRWGVSIYGITQSLSIAYDIIFYSPKILSYVMPMVVIGIGVYYWNRDQLK